MKQNMLFGAIGVILFLLVAISTEAEDGDFTVTSFIPERFRDFEWRVEGSGSSSDMENNLKRTSPTVSYRILEDVTDELTEGSLKLQSSSKYDYYSLQRFYSVSLVSELSMQDRSGTSLRKEPQDKLPRYVGNREY